MLPRLFIDDIADMGLVYSSFGSNECLGFSGRPSLSNFANTVFGKLRKTVSLPICGSSLIRPIGIVLGFSSLPQMARIEAGRVVPIWAVMKRAQRIIKVWVGEFQRKAMDLDELSLISNYAITGPEFSKRPNLAIIRFYFQRIKKVLKAAEAAIILTHGHVGSLLADVFSGLGCFSTRGLSHSTSKEMSI